MDYEIIFYHSGQTAEMEKLLSDDLSRTELNLTGITAAITPSDLADFLGLSLRRCDIVFVIGGLDGRQNSTDEVLSSVLSSGNHEMHTAKLMLDSGDIAYSIRSGRQRIYVLPDDIAVSQRMLESKIRPDLNKAYGLKEETVKDDSPSIETVIGELDQALSGMSRERLTDTGEMILRQNRLLLLYRVLITVFAAAGFLLGAGAVILGICS